MKQPAVLALALASFSFGCSSDTEPVAAASPGKAGAGAGAAAAAPAAKGSTAEFTPDPGWVVEKPSSGMRKFQARLPGADGAKDASLVVYYFGGQGGSVDANIERWTGQFEQPDGKPSSGVLKRSTRTVEGRTIHDVELAGTYVAETSPGSGERVREEGWRMLAAILETKDGPYYAKLVGPAATVGRWEESFRKFVDMARPGA